MVHNRNKIKPHESQIIPRFIFFVTTLFNCSLICILSSVEVLSDSPQKSEDSPIPQKDFDTIQTITAEKNINIILLIVDTI